MGEDMATKFLVEHGFKVIERNYWHKLGELDIVAKKDGMLHFVEVKTLQGRGGGIHETAFSPEDNMNYGKRSRMARIIEIYLNNRRVPENQDWQADLISIVLGPGREAANLDFLEDICL